MDDYLASAKDIRQGVETAEKVKSALAASDFHLRSRKFNQPDFLRALGYSPDELERESTTSLGSYYAEKVLGITWTPARDTLGSAVPDLNAAKRMRAILSRYGAVRPTKPGGIDDGEGQDTTEGSRPAVRKLERTHRQGERAVVARRVRHLDAAQLRHSSSMLFSNEDAIARIELHT